MFSVNLIIAWIFRMMIRVIDFNLYDICFSNVHSNMYVNAASSSIWIPYLTSDVRNIAYINAIEKEMQKLLFEAFAGIAESNRNVWQIILMPIVAGKVFEELTGRFFSSMFWEN